MSVIALLFLLQADVQGLIEQLEGRSCAYAAVGREACAALSPRERITDALLGWAIMRRRDYQCPLAAARCLEKMGPKAVDAVPALIRFLAQGPEDFDTGDGVIPVRSAAASALAATGDPRAIPALAEALMKDRGRSETALLTGLASFGPRAGQHWPLAARVLRLRNADKEFRVKSRAQFEARLAAEAEQSAMDRNSTKYIREFELYSGDARAIAAANALGRMKRKDAVDQLAETLKNPHAAAEAAKALAEIGDSSERTILALEGGLLDSGLGPRARSECARALGRIGAARSARILGVSLKDEEIASAAAEALGQLGGAARAALPDLLKLVRLPSMVVQNEMGGLHWTVEAWRRAEVKRAAVRAMQAIDERRAAAMLAPLRGDPDIRPLMAQQPRKPPPQRSRRRR